jgi:hypothetical protein
MKNTHPVELLLFGALLALEAAAVLLAALVALLLTLAHWRPAAAAPAVNHEPPTAPPLPAAAPWPLAEQAEQAREVLESLTVAQLRSRARSAGLPRALSRTGRRAPLLEALAGLEVAMV